MRRCYLLLAVAAWSAGSGCSSVQSAVSSVDKSILGSGSASKPIIPDSTIALSSSTSISLEKLVYWGAYAGVAYLILDPLAPNWSIEEAHLNPQLVHFSLKMKRYYSGGAGEAYHVVQRRAKALVLEGDFASYQIVEYSEGLDSSVLGSQRIAEGVVRLIPKG